MSLFLCCVGVPVKEYIQSVRSLMKLTMKERLEKLRNGNIKTILFFHAVYGSKTYGFNYERDDQQGQLPYIMKGCRRHDCFCTDQRDLIPLEEFDAILFYARLITKQNIPKGTVIILRVYTRFLRESRHVILYSECEEYDMLSRISFPTHAHVHFLKKLRQFFF